MRRGSARVVGGLPLRALGGRGARGEGDLVGVFEVGADGESGGEAGDAYARCDGAQFAGDVERGGFAGGGRVGGDDEFADGALVSGGRAREVVVVRVDAVEG